MSVKFIIFVWRKNNNNKPNTMYTENNLHMFWVYRSIYNLVNVQGINFIHCKADCFVFTHILLQHFSRDYYTIAMYHHSFVFRVLIFSFLAIFKFQ